MNLARFLHGGPDERTGGSLIGGGRAYDLFASAMFGGRRRVAYTTLARVSGARSGDRVLDVGCGTGYLTRIMAEHVGPTGRATGLDPSASVVAHARGLTRSSHCDYVDGIAERLDFPDGSYDTVVTCLVMHHLPAAVRSTAIVEMARVLRPGGRILVADFRPPSGRIGRHVMDAVVGPAMSDNDVRALAPLVRDAGFQSVAEGRVRPWLHYVTAAKPDAAA